MNGNVKIGDLGLIKDASVPSNSTVGTCYWLAPEIICGKPYNEKVDIYALGCVAYALAAGTPPYRELGALLVPIPLYINSRQT